MILFLCTPSPAPCSYNTFIGLSTYCSGIPSGWEQARRPQNPKISTGDGHTRTQ